MRNISEDMKDSLTIVDALNINLWNNCCLHPYTHWCVNDCKSARVTPENNELMFNRNFSTLPLHSLWAAAQVSVIMDDLSDSN